MGKFIKAVILQTAMFGIGLVCIQNPAIASEPENIHTVVIPVTYCTSRELQEKNTVQFTGRRNLSHVDQGRSFGVISVMVKSDEDLTPALKQLGCRPTQLKASKTKRLEVIKLNHEPDFFAKLEELKAKSPTGEVAVFVHGYNSTLEGAAESAAQLELALAEPVILFSWPSQARLASYVVDECNAEWSVRPFQIFMQQVEKHVGAENMMTVSHSMGNRLVNWYLQSRSDKQNANPHHYREIVLTSPDINRATFKNYFWKLAENADTVRLYMSSKDKALKGSSIVHGSERAGSAEMKSELRWQVPGRLPGVQTVDFTAVDAGLIGHSIQFKLISSMHKSGIPGPGYTLNEDKTMKGDYVRVARQGDDTTASTTK